MWSKGPILIRAASVRFISSKPPNEGSTTSTTAGKTKFSDFNYCVEQVKTHDFDSYLSTLLTPKKVLRAAFALRAFNIELQSIGLAREKSIAQMRLQFWKDQVEKIFKNKNTPPNYHEPITNELAHAVNDHDLSKHWLSRLVDGRKAFLAVPQVNTLADLERFADMSLCPIYYILLEALKVRNVDCDHVASHLGKCQHITYVVRNLFRNPKQSAYYVPMELLVKHKISQQDLINRSERILRPKQNQIKDLAFEILTRANQHLNSARDLQPKVPKELRLLFAASMSCEVYLKNMEKVNFDLMNPKMSSSFRVSLVMKLFQAKFFNKY